jgi:hypothetical protein
MVEARGDQPTERRFRRTAWRSVVAFAAIALFAISLIRLVTPADGAAGAVADDGGSADRPRETSVGMCLRLMEPPLADTEAVVAVLNGEAVALPHLFPQAQTIARMPTPSDGSTLLGTWPAGTPTELETALADLESDGACANPGSGWSFAVTRDVLADGADRVIEQASFGDDWDANIEVSFYPDDDRVRTTLRFSGPLGMSGSCWIDEWLEVDTTSGLPMVTAERGDDAGLAGLVACRRFEAEMTEGGAGGQATALFPDALSSGDLLRTPLQATSIEVTADLIVVRGGDR